MHASQKQSVADGAGTRCRLRAKAGKGSCAAAQPAAIPALHAAPLPGLALRGLLFLPKLFGRNRMEGRRCKGARAKCKKQNLKG
ncbi:hypothetical protein MJ8_48910 [Mesorhizobium sp. J8]|nr:hypothetical protein MJ8_48910 [Mesorhizobium sp. J8]